MAEFWLTHPRITVTEYAEQRAAEMRAARQEALFGELADVTEDITTEDIAEIVEVTEDEHTEDLAELDGLAEVGLRRVGAADAVRPGRDGQQRPAAEAGRVRNAGPVHGGRVMAITYADAEAEPLETEYNWLDRFPRGAVVLVAGWRESAKGLLTWNLTAAATNGKPLPGETEGRAPADVVMISAEDDLNEDKAWRARAAGARLDRVHDLTQLEDGSPFELSASKTSPGDAPMLLGFLRQLRVSCMCGFTGSDAADLAAHLDEGGAGCEARNPRWVFMDPLNQLVMDGSIKTDQGARRLIGRLERVARLTGVTIVIIHHFVKSGSIGGSQGLVDAPRWVYEIQPDPAAPDCKIIHTHKCNKGSPEDIRYRIIRDGHDSRIEWVQQGPGMEREERSWRGDDLAVRRQARQAAPQAAPPSVTYSAAVASRGRGKRSLGAGMATLEAAQRACEATPEWKVLGEFGHVPQWVQVPSGNWVAGDPKATAFAVVAGTASRAAV